MSQLDYDPELQGLREKSIDRLLMVDVFDAAAFDALLNYLNQKALELRDEYAVSKQILSCLRDAYKAIVSRAEYQPTVKGNIDKAEPFALLLDLIIIGETLDDRTPGVPRKV